MKSIRLITKVSLLIVATLLTGCASKHLLKDPEKTPLAVNEGVVFATFTREKFDVERKEYLANLSGTSLAIRRVGDKSAFAHLYPDGVNLTEQDGKITFNEGWPKQANATGKLSILSAIKLPAGDYEIFIRTSTLFMYPFEYRNERPVEPPQQFTVRPNELVYIGSTHQINRFGDNLLGMTVPSGIGVSTSDVFDSAYADLLKVRPDWKNMKVTNALKSQ